MGTEPTPHTSLTPEGTEDQGRVETREETLERAVATQQAVVGDQHSGARSEGGDPSTRRGFNAAFLARMRLGVLAGAVLGAGLGVLIRALTGSLGLDGALLGSILGIAVAGAIVGGILSALVTAEREDGRVERTVEEKQGADAGGLGTGLDPRHDVPTGERHDR